MNDLTPKRPKRPTITDQEALQFHSKGRPGKLEIIPTKPMPRSGTCRSPTRPASPCR